MEGGKKLTNKLQSKVQGFVSDPEVIVTYLVCVTLCSGCIMACIIAIRKCVMIVLVVLSHKFHFGARNLVLVCRHL